jgi:hypothetical protein
MLATLALVAFAPVYRDPKTGEEFIDEDNLMPAPGRGRRSVTLEQPTFGDDDDDDLGDDDFGDDDMGDDDLGDDDLGDDEVAGKRRRRRRAARRAARRGNKATKRVKKAMISTFVTGSSTLTAAGNATVSIRMQHDFEAEDVTFDGSLSSTTSILSIKFGDRLVFDGGAAGVVSTTFSSTSFLRGILKGEKIKAGLDITVVASLTGAGDLKVAVKGKKPSYQDC